MGPLSFFDRPLVVPYHFSIVALRFVYTSFPACLFRRRDTEESEGEAGARDSDNETGPGGNRSGRRDQVNRRGWLAGFRKSGKLRETFRPVTCSSARGNEGKFRDATSPTTDAPASPGPRPIRSAFPAKIEPEKVLIELARRKF